MMYAHLLTPTLPRVRVLRYGAFDAMASIADATMTMIDDRRSTSTMSGSGYRMSDIFV
jgi:hypothetical protein